MHYYVSEKWILLYVERWLKAPIETLGVGLLARTQGTPQGGVISPLLANMFLHVVFDGWMRQYYPIIKWERYADDIIIHCGSEKEAHLVLEAVQNRLGTVGLTTHPDKTQIVYCKTGNRTDNYPRISFDFLGYCFKPRQCLSKIGHLFLSFTPSISPQSIKSICADVRKYRIHRLTHLDLSQIAYLFESKLRGWIYYYGKFTASGIGNFLQWWFNEKLAHWVKHKYKACHRSINKGIAKLKELCKDFRNFDNFSGDW